MTKQKVHGHFIFEKKTEITVLYWYIALGVKMSYNNSLKIQLAGNRKMMNKLT